MRGHSTTVLCDVHLYLKGVWFWVPRRTNIVDRRAQSPEPWMVSVVCSVLGILFFEYRLPASFLDYTCRILVDATDGLFHVHQS